MSVSPPSSVRDQHPPDLLMGVVNPLLALMLLSPAGRLIRAPVIVLGFTGKRTGRRYRIPVGWHDVGEGKGVFTSAQWRLNFRGSASTTVRSGGRTLHRMGVLVEDPQAVSLGLQHAIDSGSTPRMLGLYVPEGHRLTPSDMEMLGRAMIRIVAT